MPRLLSCLVLSSLAALVAALIGAAPAPAATQEWSLTPVRPAVVLYSPYTGAATHTRGVLVAGGVTTSGELWLEPSAPDEHGVRTPLVTLSGSVGLFSRPRTFRLSPTHDDISFNPSGGCSDANGLVDLEDIGYDAAGRVTRISLDYALTCDATRAMQHGSVRWGYSTDKVAPVRYTFPATGVDDFHGSTWMTVPDSSVWSPTTVGVEGPNAADFQPTTGITCTQNGPCWLALPFVAGAGGYRRADLVLEGGGDSARVLVEGIGLPGTSSMSVSGEPTITPDDGYVRFGAYLGSSTTAGIFSGQAQPNDPTRPSYDVTLHGPTGQPFRIGVRYQDTGDSPDGTDVWIARRQDDNNPSITCGSNLSKGWFEFRQLFARPGDAPAYVVAFHEDCNGVVRDGTIRYGARTDLADPAPAGQVHFVDADTVAWTTPADAVRSVVRLRRGGLGTPTADTGQPLYAGPAKSLTLPAPYVGRAVALTVFTVDAVGNVSGPAQLVGRGATRLTIRRDAGILSGSVLDGGWGYRLAGRGVALDARRPGGSWSRVSSTTTDGLGHYRFGVRLDLRRDYRVLAPATGTHLAGVSAIVAVG